MKYDTRKWLLKYVVSVLKCTFTFYCKRRDELSTMMSWTSSLVAETTPKTVAEIRGNTITDRGGCFKDGPGKVKQADYSTGVLAFTTMNGIENETYSLCVNWEKSGRTSLTCLDVVYVRGSPPPVIIT